MCIRDRASEGRVLLQAVLLNGRAVVGQLRIATRAPAPTQDAAGGVAALRQATDDEMCIRDSINSA